MTVSFVSPYVSRPCRSEAQARSDISAASTPFMRGYSSAIAEGYVAEAVVLIRKAQEALAEATQHMPIGSGFEDHIRGLNDEIGDIEGHLERSR